MKILIYTILFLGLNGYAQQKYSVSGQMKDAATGEDLLYASVYVVETETGAMTNEYGFYSISLPEGVYTVRYSYVGYQSKEMKVEVNKNRKINIELSSEAQQLSEVTVLAEKKDKNVTRNEIGVTSIKMSEAKEIPVLMGEQDIVKTMQLMPGISSSGEGGNGYHVRGGSIDQNLILLDESPVFNASHLLGFFSVFNSDAIKDMKMYKGGTPAQFGGRSSSVLDLRMKDGNSKDYVASGGIGLLSSRLMLEGPIVKDEGSFMIAGRRTYLDLFLPLSGDENIQDSKLYFYDLNMKANYRISDSDRLFISGYFGRDVFGFEDRIGFDWGNYTGTARWNHLFNDKFFLNTTFITSSYDYNILMADNTSEMNLTSGILSYELKQDYSWYVNNINTLKFGLSVSHKTFSPGEFERVDEDTPEENREVKIAESKVLESGLYISNSQTVADNFKLDYGLRFSLFNELGGKTSYTYDEDGEVATEEYRDNSDIIKTYYGLEPRIMATYILNPSSSVKASYNRMFQYVHLMSNTTSGSPTDYWVPSSRNIEPQLTDQFSVGYFQNFSENMYEFSVETYYKKMQNMIEYKNGTSIMLNEHLEGDMLFGDGRAYGVEFLLRKNSGRFTGWLSYTLSKTEKQFDDINDGSWFPAKYDRTHDISAVAMYKLSNKWSLSASWVFQTGSAVTFPVGTYEVNNVTVKQYTGRNSYRMPDYHRLDLGATYKIADTKKYKSELVFSLYNAYGRENAYSISFEQNEDTGKNEAVQLSLFRYVPSITWNFRF